jgi:hypothetical protein
MDDKKIEAEIQAKGLTAPRVTPADIEANIAETHYFTAADGVRGSAIADGLDDGSTPPLHLLTFCVLVLRNGFTVTGESACASPENFDAEIGRTIARQNAMQKIWPLMGYALKERLSPSPASIEPPPPCDNDHVAPGCEQFPEPAPKAILCPRAAENGAILSSLKPPFNGEMVWRDDDTCSYCGSLNGDILMARIEAGTIFLEGSDKNYKVYIKATDGSEPLKAIKFYFQHLSEEQMKRFVELWNEKCIKHSLYVMPYFMQVSAPAS